MDPITFLFAAEVIQRVCSTVDMYSQDAWRAQMAGEHSKELEILRHHLRKAEIDYQDKRAALNAAERFQQEIKLAEFRHELRLKEAVVESNLRRKEQIDIAEWERILNHWPLRLYKSQLAADISPDRKYPIKVLISPALVLNETNSRHPLAQVGKEVEERLGTFLHRYYSRTDPERPVEFLGGAWDVNKMRRETAVKAIFSLLKSEPTMVIDSEVIGDEFFMRLGYWGLGASDFLYEPAVAKLPLRRMLDAIARKRARAWRADREVLRESGLSDSELEKRGGRRARNLKIVEHEERLARLRISSEAIEMGEFEHGPEDWKEISKVIETCHCLVAATVADVHHFICYNSIPMLPEALKELAHDWLEGEKDGPVANLVEQIDRAYSNLLSKVRQESLPLYPSLSLRLTESLASLPDRMPAQRLLTASMLSWLSQHGVILESGEDPLLKIARLRGSQDEGYFQELTRLDKRLSLVEDRENRHQALDAADVLGLDIGEQLAFARRSIAKLTQQINDLIEIDTSRFSEPRQKARVDRVLAALSIAGRDLERPVFRIITLAITSAGKSTVANALAGHCLAPMSQEELSAGILTLRHSSVLRLTIARPDLKNGSGELPWEPGEWEYSAANYKTTQEVYKRVRDGVMKPYQEAKKRGLVPIPEVLIEAPLLPVQDRALLGVPDGVDFEIVDLPGLNSEQDSTNLRVIQDNARRGFCLMMLDYLETNPARRDQLLQKLKKHIDGLKGRTDSIIFVLNKFDLRTSADTESEVANRIERLKSEIRERLALKQVPDIIPLNGLMWMKGQVVWGTSSAEGSPSSDPELRKYLMDGSDDNEIQGFAIDCAQDLARLKRQNDFRTWFAQHEQALGTLGPGDLRYLHETAIRFSGGAAVCECLKVRLRERFGAIVIWPVVYEAHRQTTRFLALVRRMARVGQYSSRDEILAAIDQIRRQTAALRNGVRKEQERFRKIQDALIGAMQAEDPEAANKAAAALEEEGTEFSQFIDVIRLLKDDLVADILLPMKEGLNGESDTKFDGEGIPPHLAATLTNSLSSFVSAVEGFDRGVKHEVRRAQATEKRSLWNLWGLTHREMSRDAELKRKGDDFYIEAPSADSALKGKMKAADTAYRELASALVKAMEHRLLFGLQVQARWVENELDKLLRDLFQNLKHLASAETQDQELVEAVFNGREPNPNSDQLTLPANIFRFEAHASKKEITRTKVERYSVEERIWYKPWKKHVVTKDRVVSVTYDSMTLPGPLSIVEKLEASFDAKVGEITAAISKWINSTLLGYSEELATSAETVGRELEERLEQRLAEDVDNWTADHAYWRRFQNELPRCLSRLTELRLFQES